MFQSSWTSFCISFITGAPGSGKSYTLVRDLYARMGEHEGPIVTNLPLEVDILAEAVSKKTKRDKTKVKAQLVQIPQTTLELWKDGHSSPATLKNQPEEIGLSTVDGALFILDECHLFCPARDPLRQRLWEKWLGEVRHEGWAGIYFVSQDQSKVGTAIKSHAELRYELTKADKIKDPWFGIELGLWWELFASFTGEYLPFIAITQYRRRMGTLKQESTHRVALDKEYFKYYRSLEAAGGGTEKGALKSRLLEHQKRPHLWWATVDGKRLAPTWAWFVGRTSGRLLSRVILVAAVVWICFLGGGNMLLNMWMARMQNIATANAPTDDFAEGVAQVETIEPPQVAISEEGIQDFTSIISKLPETDRARALEYLAAVREEFEAERERVVQEELDREEEERKLRRSVKVVGVDKLGAWLSDGSRVSEGESIIGGPLDGLQVVEINRYTRTVVFDDGWRCSMFQPSGLSVDEEESTGRDATNTDAGRN